MEKAAHEFNNFQRFVLNKSASEWTEEAQSWIAETVNAYFSEDNTPTNNQIFDVCKKELDKADIEGVDDDYKAELLDYISIELGI